MEVFLALKPAESYVEGPMSGLEPGQCAARWLHDASLVTRYMQNGWHVFSAVGFKRVVATSIEIVTEPDPQEEKKDGCEKCPEPAKSNNKRGR